MSDFMKYRFEEDYFVLGADKGEWGCWFCRRNKAESKYSIEATDTIEQGRTGQYTKYQTTTFRVPQCKLCYEAHKKINLLKAWVITSIVLIGGSVGLFVANGTMMENIWVLIVMAVNLIISCVISVRFNQRHPHLDFNTKKDTKEFLEGLNHYKRMQMISNGFGRR